MRAPAVGICVVHTHTHTHGWLIRLIQGELTSLSYVPTSLFSHTGRPKEAVATRRCAILGRLSYTGVSCVRIRGKAESKGWIVGDVHIYLRVKQCGDTGEPEPTIP